MTTVSPIRRSEEMSERSIWRAADDVLLQGEDGVEAVQGQALRTGGVDGVADLRRQRLEAVRRVARRCVGPCER